MLYTNYSQTLPLPASVLPSLPPQTQLNRTSLTQHTRPRIRYPCPLLSQTPTLRSRNLSSQSDTRLILTLPPRELADASSMLVYTTSNSPNIFVRPRTIVSPSTTSPRCCLSRRPSSPTRNPESSPPFVFLLFRTTNALEQLPRLVLSKLSRTLSVKVCPLSSTLPSGVSHLSTTSAIARRY